MIHKIKQLLEKILPQSLLEFTKTIYRYMQYLKNVKTNKNFKGQSVYCPCCKKSFVNFVNFNFNPLVYKASNFVSSYQNTVCPNCNSLPRHRIISQYFENNKEKIISYSPSILAIASDTSVRWLKNNNCKYTTADLFKTNADLKMDIQDTKQPDKNWGLIICNHILEHIKDYKIALKELYRILKDDGILEITVPTDNNVDFTEESNEELTDAERLERFGQIDHLRTFGKDIYQILVNSGFNVEVINGENFPNIKGVVGPSKLCDNKVYICRKIK